MNQSDLETLQTLTRNHEFTLSPGRSRTVQNVSWSEEILLQKKVESTNSVYGEILPSGGVSNMNNPTLIGNPNFLFEDDPTKVLYQFVREETVYVRTPAFHFKEVSIDAVVLQFYQQTPWTITAVPNLRVYSAGEVVEVCNRRDIIWEENSTEFAVSKGDWEGFIWFSFNAQQDVFLSSIKFFGKGKSNQPILERAAVGIDVSIRKSNLYHDAVEITNLTEEPLRLKVL